MNPQVEEEVHEIVDAHLERFKNTVIDRLESRIIELERQVNDLENRVHYGS